MLVCWGVVPHFFSSLYFILGDVVSSSFFLCNEVKWLIGSREGRRSKIRRDDRRWGYRLCSRSIGSCVFAVCHCYCFETIPHSHCPGQCYDVACKPEACAILWRAFLPGAVWTFLPLLITVVAIQEAVRLYYWCLYLKVEHFLNKLAAKVSKPQLVATDKIQIAIASGLGHGIAHSVFFCLSLLTPAFGPATYYIGSCVHMPLFLVAAFMGLGFLLLHTFSMVIAFNALAGDKHFHQLFVPVMHLCASLLTMVNLLPGVCVAGVPMTLICAVVTMAVAGKIVWDKTGTGSAELGNLQRVHSSSSL